MKDALLALFLCAVPCVVLPADARTPLESAVDGIATRFPGLHPMKFRQVGNEINATLYTASPPPVDPRKSGKLDEDYMRQLRAIPSIQVLVVLADTPGEAERFAWLTPIMGRKARHNEIPLTVWGGPDTGMGYRVNAVIGTVVIDISTPPTHTELAIPLLEYLSRAIPESIAE